MAHKSERDVNSPYNITNMDTIVPANTHTSTHSRAFEFRSCWELCGQCNEYVNTNTHSFTVRPDGTASARCYPVMFHGGNQDASKVAFKETQQSMALANIIYDISRYFPEPISCEQLHRHPGALFVCGRTTMYHDYVEITITADDEDETSYTMSSRNEYVLALCRYVHTLMNEPTSAPAYASADIPRHGDTACMATFAIMDAVLRGQIRQNGPRIVHLVQNAAHHHFIFEDRGITYAVDGGDLHEDVTDAARALMALMQNRAAASA